MSESFIGLIFYSMSLGESEFHRDALTALLLLASGEYAQSYLMFKEIASRLSGFLDPTDRALLFTQSNLATSLEKLERFEESLALYEDVLAKMRRTMGDDDPLAITTQSNMAVAMLNAGAARRALDQFRDVFEKQKRILGPEDDDTLRAHTFMAKALISLKRFPEAIDIYTDVFEKRKRRLGASHPDTLRTQGSIGYVLIKQAKHPEALKLLNQVVAKQKSILGEPHHETQGSMSYIQYLKQKVGPKKFAHLQSLCEENDDLTKLIALINSGDVGGVNALFESGIDISRVTTLKGNTPLHIAVNKNKIDTIESLLKYAKRHLKPRELQDFIEARTTSAAGNTAMHIAASNGSLEALKVLLRYGATHNVKNKKSKTPRELAKDPMVMSFLEIVNKANGQYQDH